MCWQNLEHRDDGPFADTGDFGFDIEFGQRLAQDFRIVFGLFVDDPILAVRIRVENTVDRQRVGLWLGPLQNFLNKCLFSASLATTPTLFWGGTDVNSMFAIVSSVTGVTGVTVGCAAGLLAPCTKPVSEEAEAEAVVELAEVVEQEILAILEVWFAPDKVDNVADPADETPEPTGAALAFSAFVFPAATVLSPSIGGRFGKSMSKVCPARDSDFLSLNSAWLRL